MNVAPAGTALIVAGLIAGSAIAQGAAKAPPAAPPKAPAATSAADPDRALLETQCSSCHSVDQVTSQSKTADEWAETIDRMVDHGMQITPEDNKRLTAFLAAHYGPKGGSD